MGTIDEESEYKEEICNDDEVTGDIGIGGGLEEDIIV